MKKVWTEIKFEFAFRVSNVWYLVNRYILKHHKSFNKAIKKFTWDRYTHWFKRFLALYEELEAIEYGIRG